ncbi:cytochrome c biogenesis protein CcsA [Weeksella virosa]|uniref:Cytochrome c-type biogenesis protein CcsB n=1 Tax=Weeksella virosa (strain ATCC 43766 / DSM 16922 / JCM 21250 / CCUG 30538 / CDC 9751 / IAM 14551 / NBRC 16016 / NCTC 11634 / CL345/78) TaxID=865938 RepID=F0NYV7_WEEVC|nr:cytochrome c-type biogenesis protein CcsB [Weeksella virosa DSM 16922]VEH63104.1 cytochrome c-type biogenesis protein CcsB [Weeksella virosa]
MDKLQKILFSTRTMAVLLFIYAAAMAIATFVENDYDTLTAKKLIYDATWFEILMVWLMALFIANIKRYSLWSFKKLPVLVFHLAFLFIFLGGAITRYISFEGQMPIAEGETTNEIISDKSYFKMIIDDGEQRMAYDNHEYAMTYFDRKDSTSFLFRRHFEGKYQFKDKVIKLKTFDYIPHALDTIVRTDKGERILELVTVGEGGRRSVFIRSGEIKSINGALVTFNRPMDGTIQLREVDGQILIKSPFEGEYVQMQGQAIGQITDEEKLREGAGKLAFNVEEPLKYRSLYSIMNAQFVVPVPPFTGEVQYRHGSKLNPNEAELPGAIYAEVSVGNERDTVVIVGGRGQTNYTADANLAGLNISIGYGSKIVKTPFSIRLDDFILDRYPGSINPSSFESMITVIDEGKETPQHIYMNNVMDYKGYRFFQASYFPDEQGTILSVNQDWWGTNVTYVGYFLLFTSMFVTLFWKGTRFWQLNSLLKALHQKKMILLPFFLLSFYGLGQLPSTTDGRSAQEPEAQQEVHTAEHMKAFQKEMDNPNDLVSKVKIPKEHSEKFGHLLIQDIEGRIKPIDTQALDILRKIYKKDKYYGLTANQWFIAVQLDPAFWANAPLIKVDKKGGVKLKNLTKANDDGYTSLMNLIDPKTTRFVLDEHYNKSFSKKPAERSKFDDEVINVTERFNILDNTAKGYQLKIIPVQNDPSERWTSWVYQGKENPVEIDTMALGMISVYFNMVSKGIETGDWRAADNAIHYIDEYQHKWGKNVVPPSKKVEIEVLYNKANIFFWIMIAYTIVGSALVILAFIQLFRESKLLRYITNFFIGLTVIVFILQAIGLGVRWYLTGHAPWSNGYEAIVFISWVGVLSGLLLHKNRNAFIPATGAMVAVIMMGFAHGGSMLDPQITPLVPVLKSYWLIIHVAIIVSSYGFFGLSAVLSLFSLIIMLFRPNKKIKISLKEMAYVNEISLTIGLFLLTVGTFLGGMWANESWGRYWSWDPKETWAFITVIVYAIVLHMRLVPGLRGLWAYNIAAMWSIWSVIMTYFGVNYYLSGLHSYAAGDPIPVPLWVYLAAIGMLILSIVSKITYNKYHKKKK